MRIEQATAFLFALKPRGIRFGLEDTGLVLNNLGQPQNRFGSIHLAGSNGKGSTAAFLDAMLRQAGYRVGLYTSPHLNHFRERFRIQGSPVGDEFIERAVERLLSQGLKLDPQEVIRWIDREDMVAKMASKSWYQQRGGASQFCRLTFFECTTILAMLLFAEHQVDLAVVECGMGGRLDATNVLMPLVSVITPVHMEHTMWLGDTLQAIAGEKAGIIKPGVPVVCASQAKEALQVIRRQAASLDAPLKIMGTDFEGLGSWRRARFRLGERLLGPARLGLIGDHQVGNAACAVGCLPILKQAGWPVEDPDAVKGMGRIVWPARFERLGRQGEWILDGAHNPDGALVLSKAIRDVLAGQPVRLVFGVLEDKQADSMLTHLAPIASQLHLVRPADARGRDPATLQSLVGACVQVHPSVPSALDTLAASTGPPVLITGSLTVAGEARAWLLEKGFSLTA